MIFPIYPHRGSAEELDRHAATTQDGAGAYGLAVDVWRDGEHLWRSYDPAAGESCDTWADRELSEDVARNHDGGRWGVPGVTNVHIWPVPTLSALTPMRSMRTLRDALATCCALVQLPDPPSRLDDIISENTLYVRLRRTAEPTVTRWHDPVTRAAVRAMVAPLHLRGAKPGDTRQPWRQWRATLERRAARRGVVDTSLQEGEIIISAPDIPNHLIRAAKGALGIQGHPAQRRDQTLTWYLTGAPYLVRIEPA